MEDRREKKGGKNEKKRVREHQPDRLRVVGYRTRTEGTKYFFLSMVGMSVLSAFSHITCTWDCVGGGHSLDG